CLPDFRHTDTVAVVDAKDDLRLRDIETFRFLRTGRCRERHQDCSTIEQGEEQSHCIRRELGFDRSDAALEHAFTRQKALEVADLIDQPAIGTSRVVPDDRIPIGVVAEPLPEKAAHATPPSMTTCPVTKSLSGLMKKSMTLATSRTGLYGTRDLVEAAHHESD